MEGGGHRLAASNSACRWPSLASSHPQWTAALDLTAVVIPSGSPAHSLLINKELKVNHPPKDVLFYILNKAPYQLISFPFSLPPVGKRMESFLGLATWRQTVPWWGGAETTPWYLAWGATCCSAGTAHVQKAAVGRGDTWPRHASHYPSLRLETFKFPVCKMDK